MAGNPWASIRRTESCCTTAWTLGGGLRSGLVRGWRGGGHLEEDQQPITVQLVALRVGILVHDIDVIVQRSCRLLEVEAKRAAAGDIHLGRIGQR